MNERQHMVVATVITGLILVIVYLCPWRIESTGEIQWSPIYQSPISYVQSYDDKLGTQGSSRMELQEANIVVSYLILEVFILVAIGSGLYIFFADTEDDELP